MEKPLTGVPAPTDTTRIGRQLGQGRLTVTGKSRRSGKHITLTFAAKRRRKPEDKAGARTRPSSWDAADLVFVRETYSERQIATIFLDSNTAVFKPTANAAHRFLIEHTLREAAGWDVSPELELSSADRCGRCSLPLTDPISLERGIGPDCYGKITGSKHASDADVDQVVAM